MIRLAALGSALLLAGAFVFQALGYQPCAMCIWQRWPHVVAIAAGLIALRLPVVAWLGAAAMAVSAGLGLYHTGVERDWWEGPASCTGGGDLGDLLSTAGTLVMCDDVAWELFGLSMASWNAVASLVLLGLWLRALPTPGRQQ